MGFGVPLNYNKKISLIHKVKGSSASISHSQEVPQSPLCSGSLTMEAALVFPIFLFVLVGILFFFRILQVTQNTYGALAATGSRLSIEAEEEVALWKVIGYFQSELYGENCSCIVGGKAGIWWKQIEENGEHIELQIQYKCKLPVRLFYIKYIPIKQQISIKKWTGYQKETEGEGQETWVYITPFGEVYHTSRECTHLQLSIFTIGKQEAISEGYTVCLFCKDKIELYPYYYVTQEGERYHKSLTCSGLKRTIYMIKLSETGNRRICERCGK